MQKNDSAYFITDNEVTLYYKGDVTTAKRDSRSPEDWTEILDALSAEDFDEAESLISPRQIVKDYLQQSQGRAKLFNGAVYLDGKEVRGEIVDDIVRHARIGAPVDRMLKFIENVEGNPSRHCREQLYIFIKSNQITINGNGNLVMYKWMNLTKEEGVYTDVRTGKARLRLGDIEAMDRRDVNDDPTVTCSYGLHGCTIGYLRSYHGQVLFAIEVRPQDIVSVPKDYKYSKVRMCAYKLVEELDRELARQVDILGEDPAYQRLNMSQEQEEYPSW